MATLVLGAIGTAIGGSLGGTILGVSAATIGGFVGSSLGGMIDAGLVAGNQNQRFEGARIDALRVSSSTEGAVVSRVFGRMRVAGNIIWSTDFRERAVTTTVRGPRRYGLFGPRATATTVNYFYTASFAVGLCEGPITGIGRVWADGKPLDITGDGVRVYKGSETQMPDPTIVARMGAGLSPAYRGLAYVVFEELDLQDFGNRLPQLTFEVFRPMPDADVAEGLVPAVAIIPGSGEFAYAPEIVMAQVGGSQGLKSAQNAVASTTKSNFTVSLDNLQAMVPSVRSTSLVVAWFGTDLRASQCKLRPGVEVAVLNTSPYSWRVNGVTRAAAYLVSQTDGRPTYGGTPADQSIVDAIKDCKARGLRVTFYPSLLMDIAADNSLPDPYSDNTSAVGQPAHPWRGRITCSPAAGFAGAVDKTATAASQIAALFGSATPAQFSVVGELVSFTGPPSDWGLRRMVLHYAHLCKAAGGVNAFLIGSELCGLTQVRSAAGIYPAIQQLRNLAADVRGILGAGTKISYVADWTEYFGHHPEDESGDVYFHLDALWADANIDFIGIDNYVPLSDWRDGYDHLDAQEWPAIYDQSYLQSNIEGGEGFDWHYASNGHRLAQLRRPIIDTGSAGKPWVYRNKDLRSWWANPHFNRPGGVESPTPTAWVPQSKPFWFTAFGCPAVDRGTNQPNIFYDTKSSESLTPYFSRGWRDDTIQRAAIEATLNYWGNTAKNPASALYAGRMVHLPECAAWGWDARPYPYFPALSEVWGDTESWRLGHWLSGRLGSVSLAALVRELCLRAGMPMDLIDVSGLWGAVEGYVIGAIEAPRASIAVLQRHFGFDAIESQGRLRFVMRGAGPVAEVTLDDMVLGQSGTGEVIELTRGQETELPLALKWQLARADQDYDAVMVEARRTVVDSTRILAEGFPIAAPPEMSERQANRALQETWVGREGASFRLPPSRVAVDAGDVLTLRHDGRGVEYRVVQVSDGEDKRIDAVRSDRLVYDLPVGGARGTSLALISPFGGALVQFLDLPQMFDDDPSFQPLLAVYASPWPGALAVWRSAATDAFTQIGSIDTRASFGTLLSALGPGPSAVFDNGNVVDVELVDGELSSVTDLQLFAGTNSFAVQTDDGAWEIVQARDVELIGPRRYRLRGLLRGVRGSEAHITPVKPSGARVIVINSALLPVPLATTDIRIAWNWRLGPIGLDFADPKMVSVQYTPTAEGLRPFSPVHIAQPYLRGRMPGDYTISWIRRDRDLGADSWEAVEVPMSEASEAYEVDILDGATIKRTLRVPSPLALYTAAQQIADFGTEFGPGDTLDIRVGQISAAAGRGAATTQTLIF
jgi:hypothetical protein